VRILDAAARSAHDSSHPISLASPPARDLRPIPILSQASSEDVAVGKRASIG
jgi:hypothetical protein